MGRKRNFKKAFTLIELLVVIAIIALLLSILIPSLSLAKRKAAKVVCMINTKNLSTGWYMYQEDNDNNIMSSRMNMVDEGTKVGWIGTPYDVNGNTLSNTGTNTVTDDDEIRGIKWGVLYDYLEAPDTYHCPADNMRKSIYGDGGMVFVSYVMSRALYNYPKNDPDWGDLQILKFNEITSPGMRYVFVESAEERNWNQSGHFSFGAPEHTGDGTWCWWGPMAINHGDSSVLGYADGHSTTRKWRDQYTIDRVKQLSEEPNPDGMYGFGRPPENQTQDLEFMASGWAFRYRP